MTVWIKQSTARTIKLGPFVDSTDGVTAETALTISQADIRLSKNGGDIAQTNNATGATHDELGYYDIPLDATDANTLGTLRVAVSASGALPVWQDFMVVPANVWDSLFGADKLQVHADEITAGLITAAAIATDAIDADALAVDAIAEINATVDAAISDAALATAANLATVDTVVAAILADTGTDGVVVAVASKTGYALSAAGIQAIWDALTSALTTVSSIGKLLVDNINATIGSRATQTSVDDVPTNAELTSALAAVDDATLAAIAALNDISPAEVNAEMVDALATDTYAEPAAVPAATASLKDKIGWLAMLARNKLTQTAAVQTAYADDGATPIATAAVSDDATTATRGEWS